ncbi:hypothetical protein [Arthrobacter sp. D3-16]
MRTAHSTTETEQVHRLSENLMAHLAKGREWATPGVQIALQRAAAGLDTGIETASPRLQALVRQLADELAGGVETLTPRVQERLKRVAPKAYSGIVDDPVEAGPRTSRKAWWVAGLLTVVGLGVLRSLRKVSDVPMSSPRTQDQGAEEFDAPDLAAGRI